MRVYTNEPFIKRRAKLGQYVSWGGLAILAIGMVISFRASPGNTTRIVSNDSSIVRSVARDSTAIAFLDYLAYQQLASQPQETGGAVRVLPIDGVSPSDETLSAGAYPLADGASAVVVIANPQSGWIGQEGVPLAQLAQVFSTEIANWAGIDATWPARPIKRFGPSMDSAAFDTFVAKVMAPAYGEQKGPQVLLNTPNPNYRWMIVASFGCLILGFIAANVGSYNTRRFGRSPRPDERLAKELKGFDDRYSLYSWVLPAPYVFVGPSGVYTFAVREHGGMVTNVGNRWKHKGSRLSFLLAFSNEGIGNPTQDAQQDAQKMQAYLAEHAPDMKIEVQPVALFTNPNVQLDLKSPAIPVVKPDGLKALLRQRTKDNRLDNPTLQRLEAQFTGQPQ